MAEKAKVAAMLSWLAAVCTSLAILVAPASLSSALSTLSAVLATPAAVVTLAFAYLSDQLGGSLFPRGAAAAIAAQGLAYTMGLSLGPQIVLAACAAFTSNNFG
jgi:hypothetical protein